jgi:hypothetical protein
MATTSTASDWQALSPSIARDLTDARLQLHYAAQFATSIGISYLAKQPDDSHTNLGWDRKHQALRSREVRALSHAVRVAVRPRDLTLIVLIDGSIGQRIPLHGATIAQVETVLRASLNAAGLDGRRLTLRRHYDLPTHHLARGDPFDYSKSADFAELANWYGNAAALLDELRSRIAGSEVRCWPHHFDIATLATIAPGRTTGAGMLPGDEMYPEPYFYVNAYPAPHADRVRAPLQGGGMWNTDGWTGAVLTGSRLTPDASAQATQVRAFLDSAVEACASLLRD